MQQGNILAELIKYLGVQPESLVGTMEQYGGTLPAKVMRGILAPRGEPRTLQEGAEYITRGMREGGGLLPGVGVAGSIKAFHGSPYRFTRFSNEAIGTGEGAQAFGHGHYLSEVPEVGKSYVRGKGYLYETTIHKGKKSGEYAYLEWDKKLSPEAVSRVINGFKKMFKEFPNANILGYYADEINQLENRLLKMTGGELYTNLSKITHDYWGMAQGGSSPELASGFLREEGFSGIKYPTGTLSGIKGSKESNYVVFEASDITPEFMTSGGKRYGLDLETGEWVPIDQSWRQGAILGVRDMRTGKVFERNLGEGTHAQMVDRLKIPPDKAEAGWIQNGEFYSEQRLSHPGVVKPIEEMP